jgi:hypothetical protein
MTKLVQAKRSRVQSKSCLHILFFFKNGADKAFSDKLAQAKNGKK